MTKKNKPSHDSMPKGTLAECKISNEKCPLEIESLINVPRFLTPNPTHINAYVWLFMRGDFYLPGIVAAIHSIKRNNPAADLVVMTTPDISAKTKQILMRVATHIFEIPYITFRSKQMKTQKQRDMYDAWVSSAYSKWNALLLPYKKICLLDADVIATTNIDILFELQPPAAPIASPFTKPTGYIPVYYNPDICGVDGFPEHGSTITADEIKQSLEGPGMVITATPVVLSPNKDDFDALMRMVHKAQPYGFEECHSGWDEQSLAEYYSSKNIGFTIIHQRFNYYPWRKEFITKGDVPRILHFFSDIKPWTLPYDKYSDVTTWYKMAADVIENCDITCADINIDEKNVNAAKKAEDTFINTHIKVKSVLDINKVLK